jgi:hypothetical protein
MDGILETITAATLADDEWWVQFRARIVAAVHEVPKDVPMALGAIHGMTATNCTRVVEKLQEIEAELAEHRAASVRFLYSQGLTHAAVAEASGLSRQRIHQILNR